MVLAALVALSIGTVLIRREQARTEANFRLARDAVDQMLTRLGEVELADVPQMEQVRRRMLDKALTFYEKFLAERGNDRSIRQETSRANLRLGDIEEMLGDYAAAEAAYHARDRALQHARCRSARQRRCLRRDLASGRHKLGVLLKKSNRFTESERALREAQRLRHELVVAFPDNPDDQRDEHDSVYQLGTVLARLGRVKEVEAAYAAAVDAERKLAAAHPDQRDYPRKLGRYLNNRGILLRSTSTTDQRPAEASFREALELQKPLAEKSPTVAGLQWEKARTTSNLASTLIETQGSAQAVPVYREALALFKRLADDFPSVPDYQNELAIVSFNLRVDPAEAGRERRQGRGPRDRGPAAQRRIRAAPRRHGDLPEPDSARALPHRPDYRQKLAQAERKRGILLDSIGQTAEAETVFRAAVKDLNELETRYPQVPEYQSDLAVVLQNLALNQFARNQPEEAPPALRRVDRAAAQRPGFEPQGPVLAEHLIDAYEVLEAALRQLGDHAGAAQAADALAELLPGKPIATFRSARMLGISASLAATAADLPEARRKELAAGRAALALKRLQKAVKEGAKILPRDLDAPAFDAIRASRRKRCKSSSGHSRPGRIPGLVEGRARRLRFATTSRREMRYHPGARVRGRASPKNFDENGRKAVPDQRSLTLSRVQGERHGNSRLRSSRSHRSRRLATRSVTMNPGFTIVCRGAEVACHVVRGPDRGPAPVSSAEFDGIRVDLLGVLHYRRERIAELNGRVPQEPFSCCALNDAALALAVYFRNGLSGFQRLEGDFVVVVWDRPRRRLIGARGPLGRYRLFWTRHAGGFALSTSMGPLLELLPGRTLDRDCLAQFPRAARPGPGTGLRTLRLRRDSASAGRPGRAFQPGGRLGRGSAVFPIRAAGETTRSSRRSREAPKFDHSIAVTSFEVVDEIRADV